MTYKPYYVHTDSLVINTYLLSSMFSWSLIHKLIYYSKTITVVRPKLHSFKMFIGFWTVIIVVISQIILNLTSLPIIFIFCFRTGTNLRRSLQEYNKKLHDSIKNFRITIDRVNE